MKFIASDTLTVIVNDDGWVDLRFSDLNRTACVYLSDIKNKTDDWNTMCDELSIEEIKNIEAKLG